MALRCVLCTPEYHTTFSSLFCVQRSTSSGVGQRSVPYGASAGSSVPYGASGGSSVPYGASGGTSVPYGTSGGSLHRVPQVC